MENHVSIQPQETWHDDAVIHGTRQSVFSLGLACFKAFIMKKPVSLEAFNSDGEGYTIKIRCRTESEFFEDVEAIYLEN